MTAAVPQKILLRSATGMSLNDRFSQLQKSTPDVRVQVSMQRQANAKSQRQAMHMANRQLIVPPTSRQQKMQVENDEAGRTSALLRLGNAGRGRGQRRPWRGGRGMSRARGYYASAQYNIQYVQQYSRGGRRSWRGRAASYSSRGDDQPRGTSNFRGRFVSARGGRGRGRGFVSSSRGFYSNMGGQRRGWGRGRGRRGWRRGGQPAATKELLDSELDQYMTTAE